MITSPNLLVNKVLKSKYFPQSSPLDATAKSGASWFWKSMQSAKHLLAHGIRKRVGDGRNILIWEDKWLGDTQSGKVAGAKPPGCGINKVNQLLQHFNWNRRLIKQLFNKEDEKSILSIPISLNRKPDRLYWRYDDSGMYTVRSGYKEARMLGTNVSAKEIQGEGSKEGQLLKWWKFLWKLQLKNKVKHFIWKCLNRIVPVNELLARRVGMGDPRCHRCGEKEETLEHVLFFCQDSETTWKLAPIQWDGIQCERGEFWKWWCRLIEAVKRKEGKQHIQFTCYLLWHIWKARNQWQFQQEKWDNSQTVQRAMIEWMEFDQALLKQRNLLSTELITAVQREDEALTEAEVWINVAAAVKQGVDRTGYGIIARNAQQKIIAVWAMIEHKKSSKFVAETEGIRFALIIAQREGWKKIQIQASSRILMDKIRCGITKDMAAETILEDIVDLKPYFECCSFCFKDKQSNSDSIRVAKFAIDLKADVVWKFSFPAWITQYP